ncbi:MAG: Uma2 family endonuclease [Syntrophobacteraceae bacterium]
MAETATKKATYNDLYGIPENMTGEIINGELVVTPRPSRKHVYTASAVEMKIGLPYQFGEGGGPGGWIILLEPEIGLGEHTLVPDLAGWKAERYPEEEPHNWISVCPDWVCEVLSPNTQRIDKMQKMPLYARYGVPHLWLIDPVAKTLDVFRLKSGEWVVAGLFVEGAKMRAEPFAEIEIDLNDLWQESRPGRPVQSPAE